MIQVKVSVQTSNSNEAVFDKTLQNRYTAGIEKMMQLTTIRNTDHTCSNICMVGLSSTKRPDCESPMTRNAILNVLIAPKARRWGLIFIRIVFVQACSLRKERNDMILKSFILQNLWLWVVFRPNIPAVALKAPAHRVA